MPAVGRGATSGPRRSPRAASRCRPPTTRARSPRARAGRAPRASPCRCRARARAPRRSARGRACPVSSALHALAALQPVVHVRGQPDRARVVLDRAHERLADPPHRVGRELEAAPVVELLDRADQAEVALLDQVREREAEVAVVLRDRDDELQVVLDEAVLDPRSSAPARPRPRRPSRRSRSRPMPASHSSSLQPLACSCARRASPSSVPSTCCAQLGEQRERELRGFELARDRAASTRFSAAGFGCPPRRPVSRCCSWRRRRFTARSTRAAISPVSSSPADSDSFAPVCESARSASQRVDDVARAERDRVERTAQRGGRGLELLREDDLLLALQRAGAADLLEVRLERPALARDLEILGRQRSLPPAGRTASRFFSRRDFVLLVELHHLPLGPSNHIQRTTRHIAMTPPAGRSLRVHFQSLIALGEGRSDTVARHPAMRRLRGSHSHAYLLSVDRALPALSSCVTASQGSPEGSSSRSSSFIGGARAADEWFEPHIP